MSVALAQPPLIRPVPPPGRPACEVQPACPPPIDMVARLLLTPQPFSSSLIPVPPCPPEVQLFLKQAVSSPSTAMGPPRGQLGRQYDYMSVATAYAPPGPMVGHYLATLFLRIAAATSHHLHKADLWHGHLFSPRTRGPACLLFHAKEYPRDLTVDGSSANGSGWFSATAAAMRHRNLLWVPATSTIFQLEANGGSPLYERVIKPAAVRRFGFLGEPVLNNALRSRTLHVDDLGDPRLCVYYLVHAPPTRAPADRIVLQPMAA